MPLYLGIPLALLCVGVAVFMVAMAAVMWRDQ